MVPLRGVWFGITADGWVGYCALGVLATARVWGFDVFAGVGWVLDLCGLWGLLGFELYGWFWFYVSGGFDFRIFVL